MKLQKGVMSGVMRSVMNENQKSQSQVHVTALRCLRVKPGKRGLNSRLWPVLRGGGAGSHTLPNHVTWNGQSTRHSRWVITLRPGALLEIFYFHTVALCPTIKCTLLFVTGEDNLARFDSRRYNYVILKQLYSYIEMGYLYSILRYCVVRICRGHCSYSIIFKETGWQELDGQILYQ